MRRSIFGVGAIALALLACIPASAQTVQLANLPEGEAKSGEKAPVSAEARAGGAGAGGGALSLATSVAQELAQPPRPPPVTLVLKVDLASQRVTVTEGGKVRHVWPISSGRAGFATQPGTFRPTWTSKMWHSRQYDMAPMPHAVFFNRGTAFHGTGAVGSLGQPASHGCIRLAPGNAAQLYRMVHRHGLSSTKVVVHGRAKTPAVARPKSEPRERQATTQPWRPPRSIWSF